MKKLLAFVLVACMILALGATAFADDNLVGVAMPTKDLQRWNQDGENMKAQLEAAGYQVDLQYGANDIATQVSQIENMIANGCKVLVIASIDGDSLGTVLAQAKEAGIRQLARRRNPGQVHREGSRPRECGRPLQHGVHHRRPRRQQH